MVKMFGYGGGEWVYCGGIYDGNSVMGDCGGWGVGEGYGGGGVDESCFYLKFYCQFFGCMVLVLVLIWFFFFRYDVCQR